MYDWITTTANPLAGKCSHSCGYCYVEKLKNRLSVINAKYSGKPRLSDTGIKKLGGKGKLIFVASMNDLFAQNVATADILSVLNKCTKHPENKYLFQTKNPDRLLVSEKQKTGTIKLLDWLPHGSIVAVTIESDIRHKKMGNSPDPYKRAEGLAAVTGFEKHVTIEPIMDFSPGAFFVEMLRSTGATQINIGADSGKNNLPEPSKEKILKLISTLASFTTVKIKNNLKRLIK